MPFERFQMVTEEMRQQLAPMADHLRRCGIEPTHVLFSPAWSGARRRARQQKARAHKQARAAARR